MCGYIELELMGRQDVTFFPLQPNRIDMESRIREADHRSTLVVFCCLRGCLFLTKFMMFDHRRILTQFKSKI